MSFHSWLQNLRSALATGRGQRHHGRRGSLRAATHRPNLEVLEDRCLPSFSPVTSFPVGATPQVVRTADFNNDGRLDLATTHNDGTISVLLGDGQGGFGAATSQFTALSSGRSLAVGDFNNDGNLDLAAIGFGSTNSYGWSFAELSVLLGHGDGTFGPPVNTSLMDNYSVTTPLTVRVGDFNADGNIDLVCTYQWVVNPYDPDDAYDAVEVLLGNGGGGFADRYEYRLPWSYPNGLAVADLNADGKPDVVMANYNPSTVRVLFGFGDGTLGGESVFATSQSPQSVALGDFTGDGIPDLVTAGQTVDILPGLGDGAFAPPIPHSTSGYSVVTADFNADTQLDVVTFWEGTVRVLLGRGDGTLNPPLDHAAGSSPRSVAVGDFNGDGRPDVAVADYGSNAVSVLLNDGDWSRPPQPPPPSITISDVTVTEGNTGTVNATFTLTLSDASTVGVMVHYDTADISAAAGSDYQSASGTLTFAPAETSKSITVQVIGDRLAEPNETFVVNLSGASNATIADGQGVGTILDDEPRISISDATKREGRKNTNLFTFTVTLSASYDQAVTMSFRTVDGTAKTNDADYVAKAGTLTFNPGETTKTITIEVKGDSKRESNETFYLDLFGNSSNSLFTKSRGLGTILNDD